MLYSSHFRDHGHAFDGCDWVVCWLDDAGSWPSGVTVVELAEVAADGASPEDVALAQEIIACAKREGLGPKWLANPSAVFAIGPDVQYFKVYATGHIRFPFSRLPPNPKMPELFARLNDTVPALGLEQGDERTKGKGGRLSELFPTSDVLDRFLSVWKWYRDLN